MQTNKRIFHVDLDAFYASVEQREAPELKGKPVIIGASPGKRGVVSACSYEARQFGVRSAMPISTAKRLCPEGIFLPVRMKLYQKTSSVIMESFSNFTPDICQISIDEAFLDMSGTEKLFGTVEETGIKIKQHIKNISGLTISVGAAPTRFLAKLASDYGKPDGLYIVNKGEEIEFLDRLELKDIWGLGKKTLERLKDMGITTIPALRELKEENLKTIFGQSTSSFLYNACRGINIDIYSEKVKHSSISNETTFQEDINNKNVLENTILELSHHVMFRAMKSGKKSKSVSIKLRYSDFTSTTAQKTLDHHIHSAEEIYQQSLKLLYQRWNGSEPIRLVGIGLLSVEDINTPEQCSLFEDSFEKKKKVEEAVFNLKNKGSNITKASLLKNNDKH